MEYIGIYIGRQIGFWRELSDFPGCGDAGRRWKKLGAWRGKRCLAYCGHGGRWRGDSGGSALTMGARSRDEEGSGFLVSVDLEEDRARDITARRVQIDAIDGGTRSGK